MCPLLTDSRQSSQCFRTPSLIHEAVVSIYIINKGNTYIDKCHSVDQLEMPTDTHNPVTTVPLSRQVNHNILITSVNNVGAVS